MVYMADIDDKTLDNDDDKTLDNGDDSDESKDNNEVTELEQLTKQYEELKTKYDDAIKKYKDLLLKGTKEKITDDKNELDKLNELIKERFK